MSDPVIEKKITQLEEIISLLKEFGEIPKEKFIKDKKIYFGAIYALVVGIEIICDIGNHILSYYFGRQSETYKDIVLLLAELEVMPKTFAKKTENMVGFRNLAIHVYAKVDPKKVYRYLPEGIKQFNQYSRYFLKFLSGKKSVVDRSRRVVL